MSPTDHDVLEVRNPATGELLASLPMASERDVAAAIAAAGRAASEMRELPAHERAAMLARVAQAIEDEGEPLARLLATENGKPIRQTRGEVAAAVRIFRGFGEEAKRLFGRQIPLDAVPGLERHLAVTFREPIGVVAAVVPFNYPLELYAHKAAAALAAGNAVIVKPPEKCPLTVLRVGELVEAAGCPSAAHQVVLGGPAAAQQLAASPGVALITLTGSTAAGRAISELAAQTLKKVHLELGGNDPLIVCADADVDLAVDAVVLGRLARGNGQICCAVKRVFVDDALYDAFAQRLAERAGALVVGDPLDERTDVGPLITVDAARRVDEQVRETVAGGATTLAGGPRDGAFIPPTVLAEVRPAPHLGESEVFGPVAPLTRFSDPADAVRAANSSQYGLQAAVFTRDIGRAFSIARRLDAGGVIVNGSTALRAENLPFGGGKLTGGAREGLHDTLLDMTETKTVVVMEAFA